MNLCLRFFQRPLKTNSRTGSAIAEATTVATEAASQQLDDGGIVDAATFWVGRAAEVAPDDQP